MASPVFPLVRFGLSSPSLAPSEALFLLWESLSIAFILASSALPLSALSLLHVSVGELSSSAIICCIRSSNSLGSSGDIPDALSSTLIFFLYLFTKTLMWSRMALWSTLNCGESYLFRTSTIFFQVSLRLGVPFLYT